MTYCVYLKTNENLENSFASTGSADEEAYQGTSSPLQIIESFLEALTNADKDGRVVVNKQGVVWTG